jgi:hypothetical protein
LIRPGSTYSVATVDIINITDIETGFKIDFRKVWPCLGFSKQSNAKRSLSRNFKEGVDYICAPHGAGQNELSGLSEDYDKRAEIIMLTLQCTLNFLTIVNMPIVP